MLHNKIDYNLFQILLTIYQEQSITGAAAKLNLTQPAVSHALARLREKFADPLFVRHGRKMQATPQCIKMIPAVKAGLASLNHTLSHSVQFDIKQHQGKLKLGFRDLLEALFFPALMQVMNREAPQLQLRSQQFGQPELERQLQSGDVDLAIDILFATQPDINNCAVCNDDFVLVSRPGHPISSAPDIEEYMSYGHIVASLNDADVNLVDIALTKHQRSRRVALRCETYFSALYVMNSSDLLMTIPRIFAQLVSQHMPIQILPVPFAVAPLQIHMYWHEKLQDDPVNLWLRGQLMAIAEELLP